MLWAFVLSSLLAVEASTIASRNTHHDKCEPAFDKVPVGISNRHVLIADHHGQGRHEHSGTHLVASGKEEDIALFNVHYIKALQSEYSLRSARDENLALSSKDGNLVWGPTNNHNPHERWLIECSRGCVSPATLSHNAGLVADGCLIRSATSDHCIQFAANHGEKVHLAKCNPRHHDQRFSFPRYSDTSKIMPGHHKAGHNKHAINHRVVVGKDGKLVYTPHTFKAAVGDTVTFEFRQKNHTVTQSSFDNPCQGVQDGFKSGFKPVNADVTFGFPTFTIDVKDDKPIWGYCGQVNHCQSGMVFGINAPASGDTTFEKFLERAKESGKKAEEDDDDWNDDWDNDDKKSESPPANDDKKGHEWKDDKEGSKKDDKDAEWKDEKDGKWKEEGKQDEKDDKWKEEGEQDDKDDDEWKEESKNDQKGPHHVKTHKIIVGPDGKLAYEQASIKASVGDKVLFSFRQKNHTVTRSSFETPCSALAAGGFKSGFQPVAVGVTSDFPEFEITVTDDKPIWGYCGQVNHCAAGMVFAVNAPDQGDKTFAKFLERAKQGAAPTTKEGGGTQRVFGAINDDDDDVLAQERALLRNSYILMGLLGGVILALIIVIVLVARGRGRETRTRGNYAKVTAPQTKGGEETFSFTHPPETRYGD